MSTLYLKYRPQTLEELDLESVRGELKKIISSGNIPHGFLFSGPKGTGKTSAARIFAKIINCEAPTKDSEPCNKCDQCTSITNGSNLDVIELDAASNRGIDDIRALREGVKLSPAKAKKKVYIIDEAHMLTTEAANAFLKTLEEPPSHVVFILATTNPEKLIETVRSRLTSINFKKASSEEIKRQLSRVMKKEKIEGGDDVVHLIVRAADGSFRDALKVLEQLILETKKLNAGDVENYLFQSKVIDLDKITDFIEKKDLKSLFVEFEHIVQSGGSLKLLADRLIERLRLVLMTKIGFEGQYQGSLSKKEIMNLIKNLLRAKKDFQITPIPQLPLEIAFINFKEKVLTDPKKAISIRENISQAVVVKEKVKVDVASSSEIVDIKEVDNEIWKKILLTMRPINTSVEALLRAVKPIGYDGKTLTLGVFYKFHKERLETIQYRKLLEDVVTKMFGNPVKIVCILTEPAKKVDAPLPQKEVLLTESQDRDIIKAAEEIFGS